MKPNKAEKNLTNFLMDSQVTYQYPRMPIRLEIAARILASVATDINIYATDESVQANVKSALNLADSLIEKYKESYETKT